MNTYTVLYQVTSYVYHSHLVASVSIYLISIRPLRRKNRRIVQVNHQNAHTGNHLSHVKSSKLISIPPQYVTTKTNSASWRQEQHKHEHYAMGRPISRSRQNLHIAPRRASRGIVAMSRAMSNWRRVTRVCLVAFTGSRASDRASSLTVML